MRNYNKDDYEKIKKEEDKKDKLMVLFALVILMLSVAYGVMTRKIISTSPVSNNAIWNVSFDNIKTIEKTDGADNLIKPRVENTNAFIDAGFNTVGDSITYEITVINRGTLNAKLNSIYLANPDPDNYEYIFDDIEEGDVLLSGKSQTFRLTIRVKNDENKIKNHFYISFNYVQQ